MSLRRALAVSRRIVAQFRHDRASVGLLIVAPILVLSLVGALWGSNSVATVRVIVANDRGSATGLVPVLERDAAIDARESTYELGVTALRDGTADAVLVMNVPTPSVLIEGSSLQRNGAVLMAIQKALAPQGSPAGPRVEYLYGGAGYTLLDYLAPVFVAFFAFFFIFLLASVSFLRERTSGTLERLLATPLRRGELVLGYLLGFSAFALIQAVVILAFTVLVLGVEYRGSVLTAFVIEVAVVIVAVSLGLLVSAFARTELQATQSIPIVILPQAFLSGLLVPVEQLPDVLRAISNVLPLTYATEALRAVMIKGAELTDPLVMRDLGVLALFGVVTLIGAVASIRREVA